MRRTILALPVIVADTAVVDELLGKMLYWTDCDNNAARCDATPNNLHTTNAGANNYATGLIATALDNTSTFLEKTTTSAFSGIGTTGFTIGAWIKNPAGGDADNLVGQWTTSSQKFALRIVSGNYVLSVSTDGTAATSVVAGAVPGDSNFHLVMGWYDPVADLIYASIDNGAATSAAFSGTLHTTTSAFTVGRYATGALMDGVFVADAPLSAAERTWVYNGGAGRDWIYPTKLLPMDGFAVPLSNSDRTATHAAGNGWFMMRAVGSGRTSGKYYFEMAADAIPSGGGNVGVVTPSAAYYHSYIGIDTQGWGWNSTALKWHNGSSTAYGSSYTTGDIIGVAFDITAGKVWFAKNGVWQGSGDPAAGTNEAFSGLTGRLMPAIGLYYAGNAATVALKDADLTYAPPTGFLAWEQPPA